MKFIQILFRRDSAVSKLPFGTRVVDTAMQRIATCCLIPSRTAMDGKKETYPKDGLMQSCFTLIFFIYPVYSCT